MNDCYNKAIEIYNEKGIKSAWSFWRLMGNYNALIIDHVECSSFISPNELFMLVDLRHGKSLSKHVTWIKLILDGNILWIPTSPLKRYISKVDLKRAYLIGDTYPQRITIGDMRYDVTLLKGFSKTPRITHHLLEIVDNQYSEFDRVFQSIKNYLNIHANNPVNKFNTSYAFNMLAGLHNTTFYSHCQENAISEYEDGISYPLLRSIHNLSCDWTYDNLRIDECGWIPALRLVED